MSVTIYHNPRCSKSRETLEIIRGAANGAPLHIISYLETPPDAAAIDSLLSLLAIKDPREIMRKNDPLYKNLNLGDPSLGREALIAAIAAHPALLERPIVVTGKGAKLCRPPELVRQIL